MKLKPTIGNKRIIELVKDIEGILNHEELAVKHGISVHNLRYLLRKMTDMGIIQVERTRTPEGVFGPTYVTVLKNPELDVRQ
jgi:transcription initiation factor IIE alpha subunit